MTRSYRAWNRSNRPRLPAFPCRTGLSSHTHRTGTNVLDLNNGGGTVSLTGRIEGTGGSNTFDAVGAILLPPLVLIRFP